MHYFHQFLTFCYLLLTLLTLGTIIMFTQEISWAGFWTDRIIIWLWLGLSMYMVVHYWRLPTTKILFYVAEGVVGLSLAPMGIPFIATVGFLSGANLENQKEVDVRYELRVNGMIMGPSMVNVIENHGIWEKQVAKDQLSEIAYQVLGEDWAYDYDDFENFSVRLVAENKEAILLEYQTPTHVGVFSHLRIP